MGWNWCILGCWCNCWVPTYTKQIILLLNSSYNSGGFHSFFFSYGPQWGMELTLVRAAAGCFFSLSLYLLCACLIKCGWWTSCRLPGDCYSHCVAVKPRSGDEVRLTFLSGPPQGVCKDPEPIQTGSQIKSLSLLLPPLTGPINYLAPARVNQKAEGIWFCRHLWQVRPLALACAKPH